MQSNKCSITNASELFYSEVFIAPPIESAFASEVAQPAWKVFISEMGDAFNRQLFQLSEEKNKTKIEPAKENSESTMIVRALIRLSQIWRNYNLLT